MKVVALTGHRPEDCKGEAEVRERVRQALDEIGAEVVITGMAAGVDVWGGDEARQMGLELWCAKPWATHSARKADRELYEGLIEYASKIVVVTEADTYPGPWVYHKRNEWMVDHADSMVAYWSGKKSGGTYACINYAQKVGREVTNVY